MRYSLMEKLVNQLQGGGGGPAPVPTLHTDVQIQADLLATDPTSSVAVYPFWSGGEDAPIIVLKKLYIDPLDVDGNPDETQRMTIDPDMYSGYPRPVAGPDYRYTLIADVTASVGQLVVLQLMALSDDGEKVIAHTDLPGPADPRVAYSPAYMEVLLWNNTDNAPANKTIARQIRIPHDTDSLLETGFFGVIEITDGLTQKLALRAQSTQAIANFGFEVFVHNLVTGNGAHLGSSLSTRGGPGENGTLLVETPMSIWEVWGPDTAAAWDEYTPADPSENHLLNVAPGPLLIGGTFAAGYSSNNPL